MYCMCFLPICCFFPPISWISCFSCTRTKWAFFFFPPKEPSALEMPSPPPNPANLNSTPKPASGFQRLSPYFHTNIRISQCFCCEKILINKERKVNRKAPLYAEKACSISKCHVQLRCPLTAANNNKSSSPHLKPLGPLMLFLGF